MGARILGVVIAAALAVIGVSAWAAHRGSGWAEYPVWLEALSTFAAFAAAGVAVYFASSAFKLESERSSQAARVAGWWGKHTQTWGGPNPREITRHTVLLRNASDVPVTNVRIGVWMAGVEAGTYEIGILPPDVEPQGYNHPREIDDKLTDLLIELADDGDHVPEVELWFTDSSGRHWHRARDGKLRTATPPPGQHDKGHRMWDRPEPDPEPDSA